MCKKDLEAVNKSLISHLLENGIKNACYYEPHVPNVYWNGVHKKIAYCNLEPYSTNETADTVIGIKPLDEERFFCHWFFNKTVGTTVLINYLLNYSLKKDLYLTENIAKDIAWQLKHDSKGYDILCDDFSKSMYFNFRYSQSNTISADNSYIFNKYVSDEFYRTHYRNFVKAAEIDILIVSSSAGAGLIPIIYPELRGKFKYCGEGVLYDGVFFVSMPHPSRISWKSRVELVNKIIKMQKQ